MKPKVLVTRYLFKEEMNFLREALSDHEIIINMKDEPLSKSQLKEKIQDVVGILSTLRHFFDEEILSNAKNLKVISNYAVGFNNIDIDYAKKRGIIVTNTPDVLTDATADLTIALILAVTRRIIEADKFLREGNWIGWKPSLLLGTDLHGKILGIIGLGRIGKAVALRAKAFGMKLIYNSQKRKSNIEAELGIEYKSLADLLQSSDIVSLHVPLTSTTKNLISTKEFDLMKNTAFFINTSRGDVVDEEALIDALKKNKIAGAGLDVFKKEPLDVHNKLINFKNVVLLPHIGSATIETRKKMAQVSIQNLIRPLRGKEPLYRVV